MRGLMNRFQSLNLFWKANLAVLCFLLLLAPVSYLMDNQLFILPSDVLANTKPADKNDSIFAEYLRKHGPGIQHLGTRVSDLDYEIEWFKERGVGVVSKVEVPGIRIAYLDTEPMLGFHIELVETLQREPGLAR